MRALLVLVLLVTPASAQMKMIPGGEPELRYTCDEASGICSMPVKDLLVLVELAQGARDCR